MSSAATRPRKRQRRLIIDAASVAGDAMAAIEALRRELPVVARAGVSLAALGFPRAREVAELDREEVEDRVESIALRVIQQIAQGKGFGFDVPSRAASNQKYIEAIDRVVLMDRVSRREFLSTASVRKTVITLRVLQILHSVLQRGIHTTKRDIFYTDCKLFKSQGESDAVLDDIACMVGCTRSSLGVVASEKGVVVGCLTYYEGGDLIDCRRVGIGGKAIPPYMEHVRLVSSDAKFILLVEKDAAFNRLAEDRFYNTYPCIIMTAKGQPDVASRLFLRKLRTELNIPVLGLVDSDPYGLKILSVYMSGSKNMSYDSANLTTPDIKWLGLRPSDLERFEIDDQSRLDMTEHDRKTGRELEKEEFIQRNPAWMEELRVMISSKKKAEIQALNSKDIQFLTKVYLPQKLREGDWI